MSTNRIIIYPKDVQRITGKSERYGRALLKQIKNKLDKEDYQFVTVDEFCQFTGIKPEQVEPFLVS
ncbi:MAG TPA: hypothetical protein VIH57_10620 [Bacteroidales bacterium]